ncbi:beta-barrel assembly-enhancing protease [Ruminiclostridium hungatei]|uniref:Beta-barrel assembly-enhancing protease n=1 Tax=Ruminiclostridium hungatei TaxID=48256 RepID=A0A1V4SIQ0_RUMHU|nr:tetratricopeptide repeat protein [Ruminiclostridium hungatei]OPX43759.1 beta-barrel assembly-enhancing protease [Ruminiclostridium hungatei]
MLLAKIKCNYYKFKTNKAYARGNAEETLFWLERVYKTGVAKPNAITTYGYLLLKDGRLEEAMKIFQEQFNMPNISNTDYYNIKANYALGLWKQGKLEEAVALLEKIIPDYKNTNIYGSLGYLYNLQGDLEKALKFNLEASEYNSTGGVILDNLGQTYYLMGDLEKAQETFKKLMTLNPKFPEAYYDYALVLEKLGDRENAVAMLKDAQQHKINYLSAVTKEHIEAKLAQLA